MKNKMIYISGGMLGLVAVVMVVGAFLGRAADAPAVPYDSHSFVDYFCFGGKVPTMDVSDIVDTYTKATNDYFNQQIAKMMADPKNAVPSVSLEDYTTKGGNLCVSNTGTFDMTCMSIAVCNLEQPDPANDITINPYCMGVTLLGVPPAKWDHYDYTKLQLKTPLQTSYFCYKAALDEKRDSLYDSTPQGILEKCDSGSEFADKKICQLKKQLDNETDVSKQVTLRRDLAAEMSQKQWWSTSGSGALSSLTGTLIDLSDSTAKRVKFIDEEIPRAKQALDQTLDAYNQMRTAWQLHVRYMDIFAELVKYRDHIVEIRKSTDAFPIKFIDATTTKCL